MLASANLAGNVTHLRSTMISGLRHMPVQFAAQRAAAQCQVRRCERRVLRLVSSEIMSHRVERVGRTEPAFIAALGDTDALSPTVFPEPGAVGRLLTSRHQLFRQPAAMRGPLCGAPVRAAGRTGRPTAQRARRAFKSPRAPRSRIHRWPRVARCDSRTARGGRAGAPNCPRR